nr:integrase, catalytic region, zinc finger, CCHC-type, peptidase aspartic, catalytic [Tanacetum cinerariifolium]
MADLSKDIQCASSNTRPPILDRIDFASWKQRIRLYYRGKENGVDILKSIDEGPFQMGTVWEPLAEGIEGPPHIGPEHPQVYSDLSPEEKDRYNTDIRSTNILLQGLPKDIYTLINHYTDAKDIWDNVKMLLEGSELTKEDRESQLYDDFEHFQQHKGETIHDYYVWFAKLINDTRNIKMTMSKMQLNSKFVSNMLPEWGRFVTTVKLNRELRDSNYDQLVVIQNVQGRENRGQRTNPRGRGAARYGGVQNRVRNANLDMDEQPVQDLALNIDNVFQADDYDAFDSNFDEAPTTQTMFMANLSSTDYVNDEAGPSYDSDILSEVQDHDHYQNAVCAHHEEHAMHDNVQLNRVVNSYADYTSDSNMISYVKDNAVPVVHSNVSSVPNDAYIMIYTDMYEPHAQTVSKRSLNTVVKNSLTAELATYKEQVELYERRASYGYNNPLCLTRAKQVQPALYNGPEIIKDNHVSAIVHNTEDTLEIAEITRRKMNDKMKDLECVTHKVKIAPHDYSKEKFLATFTPQKQLTPKQIFWSQDLIKMKSEALREQTTVSRPINTLTVYPPNTPAMLVPRVLLIKRERGFEQTKACYLKEVKENFEGIQKALTKEIKEMKDVFEELEAEAHCLELEAELSNLRDKSHNDNHDELVNRFSNLEVNHLNLQLKYQNLKDILGNNPSTPNKHTPDFDSVFVIGKMQASLQGKDNVIRQLKKQISHLQKTRTDTDCTLKVRAVDSQITQLTEKVNVLQAQNDSFRAVTALTTKNVNLKAQILDTANGVSKEHVKPKVLAPRKYAIDFEPIVSRLRNNREAYIDYLRHLKESVKTIHDIVEEAKVVVQIVFWYLDSGCLKHMTGDHSRLMNFVKKFIGTVKFRNDHFGAIMGYGDYVIGDSVIFRVYYVEGLRHNLFSVRQFCDSDLKVAFRKHSYYVRDTDVQAPVNSAGTPSFTTIDQDAPSPSISPSSLALQSYSLHQGTAAESTFVEDNLVPPVDNNPFINVFTPEPSSDASSSGMKRMRLKRDKSEQKRTKSGTKREA